LQKELPSANAREHIVSDHALFQTKHRHGFAAFDASHAAAAFLEFPWQQSDFGWCGYRACQTGRNRFRIIPKPELSADRSDATRM
jgi:hypothetical protein